MKETKMEFKPGNLLNEYETFEHSFEEWVSSYIIIGPSDNPLYLRCLCIFDFSGSDNYTPGRICSVARGISRAEVQGGIVWREVQL